MSLGSIPDDIRVPLVYIDIDNSQAMGSAPAQSRKVIVIGHQGSAGTATALTQNRITSDGMAEKLYGKGSQLAEMLKMHRKANRNLGDGTRRPQHWRSSKGDTGCRGDGNGSRHACSFD